MLIYAAYASEHYIIVVPFSAAWRLLDSIIRDLKPGAHYRVYKKKLNSDFKLLSISQNTYLYPIFYIYSFFGYL
jgi:hypothetical protein